MRGTTRPTFLTEMRSEEESEKVRARLVVREIKKAKSKDENLEPSDLFSAMPPVESLKASVSHVMTERVDGRGRNLVLAVFDVSRAHVYGVCERDVYVEPPSDLHRPGLVAKLNKTMFGTQDASNAWKKLWGEHLRSSGFELVASNPALYRSVLVNCFCHGDDFVTEDQIESFGKLLQEKFDTRRIGMTGAAEHLDKELEVLHRSVRVINNWLVEIEADQKRVRQLLEDLGLTQSNIAKTSRVKLSAIEAEAIENSPILEGEQATTLRSGTMRCAYLALDRVDISEAIKCLARAMSKPKAGHMTQLKRVARYVKGVPRAKQSALGSARGQRLCWRHRNASEHVWSACAELRHSSTVQNVIGLSSAESEYYALTKGGCSGLGLQSFFADWNLKLQLSLHPDSSSAKAVASRRGAGKSTRHIQTRMLWLQERVAAKHLRVVKVANESNLADIQTQRVVRQNLMRRRWTRNPRKSRSSRKSSLQLKRWKRVMQRSRTNQMMMLQRSRTSRRM